MMWSWFDGHMVALLFIIPMVVFIGVGIWNARSRRRWEKR